MIGITLKGGKQLERALLKLPGAVQRRVIRRAATMSMRPVLKSMRRLAGGINMKPDARREYQKSIVAKTKTYSSTGVVVVMVGAKNEKLESGRNWANLGHFFELGVAPHEIKASKKLLFDPVTGVSFGKAVAHPGISAQPHVRPALDSNSNTVIHIYTRELRAGIAREAVRLRGTGA